jgi:hypothetical protein
LNTRWIKAFIFIFSIYKTLQRREGTLETDFIDVVIFKP